VNIRAGSNEIRMRGITTKATNSVGRTLGPNDPAAVLRSVAGPANVHPHGPKPHAGCNLDNERLRTKKEAGRLPSKLYFGAQE